MNKTFSYNLVVRLDNVKLRIFNSSVTLSCYKLCSCQTWKVAERTENKCRGATPPEDTRKCLYNLCFITKVKLKVDNFANKFIF